MSNDIKIVSVSYGLPEQQAERPKAITAAAWGYNDQHRRNGPNRSTRDSESIFKDPKTWKLFDDDNFVVNLVRRMAVDKPKEVAEKLFLRVKYVPFLRFMFDRKVIEFYRFMPKAELQFGAGTSKAGMLSNNLNALGFETLSVEQLTLVEREIAKRQFSLTSRETNFLPVWVKGKSKPTNASSQELIGVLFHTYRGDWFLFLNRKNFERLISEGGGTARTTYRDRFPRGEFDQPALPDNAKAFQRIHDKSSVYKYMADYFRPRLMFLNPFNSVRPINRAPIVSNVKPE